MAGKSDTTKSQQALDANNDDEFDDDKNTDELIEQLTNYKGAMRPGRPKNQIRRRL